MELIENTKRKLSAILRVVDNLKSGDFPHNHALLVLDHIEKLLLSRIESLEQLHENTNKSVVNTLCKAVLGKIFTIYPLLGFILRSTNIRNSFELHGPFLRLVKSSVGDDAKLVISSEWDFSPFTYQMPEDLGLNNVVFIGIPASESENALAIPLTGHELGHNLWRKQKYLNKYSTIVEERIVGYISEKIWDEFKSYFPDIGDKESLEDMLGKQAWQMSWVWAISQCEELFCDFIGLLIFQKSYLYAFAYLLAPGLPGSRSEYYPTMTHRVSALVYFAQQHDIDVPAGYLDQFEDSYSPSDDQDKFLVSISDYVSGSLVEELGQEAKRLSDTHNLNQYSRQDIETVISSFVIGVPATASSSLTNIINAAWEFYRGDIDKWKDRYPNVYADVVRRDQMLNDLAFKSVEVLEINEIQGA